MTTTTLYAELVVVGTGAAIFLLLVLYYFSGDPSFITRLGKLITDAGAVSLIPGLSIIYLLGVINTNLAFLLFKWPEDYFRRKALGHKEYGAIQNKLYKSSYKDLIEDFHFRRSKIRICRGWFLNFLLIFVTLIVAHEYQLWMPRFSILTIGVLMIVSAVSWWSATKTELDGLRFF